MGAESENQKHLDELRRKIQTMSDEELIALAAVLRRIPETTFEEMEIIALQLAHNSAAQVTQSRQG